MGRKVICILAALAFVSANTMLCNTLRADEEEDNEKLEKTEKKIPLAKVPAKVRKVAEKAVKGIKLFPMAKVEKEKEGLVYELKGKANSKTYEIEVKADGTLLEVETDDGDDDDDDDKGDKKKDD